MSKWIVTEFIPIPNFAEREAKAKELRVWLSRSAKGRWKVTRPRKYLSNLRVKIKSTDDHALFKLFFSDEFCVPNLASVILPMMRRAMPSILAADICGVQPMTPLLTPKERYELRRGRHKQESNPFSLRVRS